VHGPPFFTPIYYGDMRHLIPPTTRKPRNMTTPTKITKPKKLSFTKKAFAEDAYDATKAAMEQVYDNMNVEFSTLETKLDKLTKKVTVIAQAQRIKTPEPKHALEGSLGYTLGHGLGNVRAVQHPVAGTHLAMRGIGGFFAAFKQGWDDRQQQYTEMVEELDSLKVAEAQVREAAQAKAATA
jgi:hypothetical protein